MTMQMTAAVGASMKTIVGNDGEPELYVMLRDGSTKCVWRTGDVITFVTFNQNRLATAFREGPDTSERMLQEVEELKTTPANIQLPTIMAGQ